MKWFRGRRGLDLNFAKKQKWWDDISHFIVTDEETQLKLVDYIFHEVGTAKAEELDYIKGQLLNGYGTNDMVEEIDARKQLIIYFLTKAPEDEQKHT